MTQPFIPTNHSALMPTIRALCIVILCCLFCSQAKNPDTFAALPKRKLIKILSIDGGGIRGIIPAFILKALEDKLKNKRHLAECFDVMAGTSTGGIIVLFLNTPGTNGQSKFRAQDIIDFYRNLGPKVFYRSPWHYITTLSGWIGEKYSAENLENSMQECFGDTKLHQSLTNLIIPAYDISQDDMVFFKTDKAQTDLARNFYFKDIGRATSAAPTYFKPAKIQDINQHQTYDLIDGGVAVNNPTLSACVHALKLFGKDNDFLIVSLGTGTSYGSPQGTLFYGEKEITTGGKLEWADSIVPVMMYAANDVVDYQMNEIFTGTGKTKKYFRIQVALDPAYAEMDNTSPDNIHALEKYAAHLIKTHDQDLSTIARLLDK